MPSFPDGNPFLLNATLIPICVGKSSELASKATSLISAGSMGPLTDDVSDLVVAMKAAFSAMKCKIPDVLFNKQTCLEWFKVVGNCLIACPVLPPGCKLPKWTVRVLTRFMNLYANGGFYEFEDIDAHMKKMNGMTPVARMSKKEAKDFALWWLSSVAQQATPIIVGLVTKYSARVSPSTKSDSLSFLSSAADHAACYATMKPSLPAVMSAAFELSMDCTKEMQLMACAPEKFLAQHSLYNFTSGDCTGPALDLLKALVSSRTKDALPPLLAALERGLHSAQDASGAYLHHQSMQQMCEKAQCTRVLGALAFELVTATSQKKALKSGSVISRSQLQQVLMMLVLPELASSKASQQSGGDPGLLAARVLLQYWSLGCLESFLGEKNGLSDAELSKICLTVVEFLLTRQPVTKAECSVSGGVVLAPGERPSLPVLTSNLTLLVLVKAVTSIRPMLKKSKIRKLVTKAVSEHIVPIIKVVTNVADCVQIEGVIYTLEFFVDKFGKAVAPFAKDIVAYLLEYFLTYVESTKNSTESQGISGSDQTAPNSAQEEDDEYDAEEETIGAMLSVLETCTRLVEQSVKASCKGLGVPMKDDKYVFSDAAALSTKDELCSLIMSRFAPRLVKAVFPVPEAPKNGAQAASSEDDDDDETYDTESFVQEVCHLLANASFFCTQASCEPALEVIPVISASLRGSEIRTGSGTGAGTDIGAGPMAGRSGFKSDTRMYISDITPFVLNVVCKAFATFEFNSRAGHAVRAMLPAIVEVTNERDVEGLEFLSDLAIRASRTVQVSLLSAQVLELICQGVSGDARTTCTIPVLVQEVQLMQEQVLEKQHAAAASGKPSPSDTVDLDDILVEAMINFIGASLLCLLSPNSSPQQAAQWKSVIIPAVSGLEVLVNMYSRFSDAGKALVAGHSNSPRTWRKAYMTAIGGLSRALAVFGPEVAQWALPTAATLLQFAVLDSAHDRRKQVKAAARAAKAAIKKGTSASGNPSGNSAQPEDELSSSSEESELDENLADLDDHEDRVNADEYDGPRRTIAGGDGSDSESDYSDDGAIGEGHDGMLYSVNSELNAGDSIAMLEQCLSSMYASLGKESEPSLVAISKSINMVRTGS